MCFVNQYRPMTQSGRPITGFVRPSTQSGRPGTMEQAIKTPRTASTARPVTSSSGRFIRLGTVKQYQHAHCCTQFTEFMCVCHKLTLQYIFQASMITNPEGPFINLSRLNLAKYSQKNNLSRVKKFRKYI